MAIDRSAPKNLPGWARTLEWALVAAVIIVLVLVLARQARVLQGQAERSAIQSTLGALRTALVIDHLQQSVAAGTSSVVLQQRNPFELLQRRPVNYLGEFAAHDDASPPPGSWVFNPACPCVGYAPLYPQWLDSPSGDPIAWFRISGAPGPLQLTAREDYVWQGEPLH